MDRKITRRDFNGMLLSTGAASSFANALPKFAAGFVHPGLLHTRLDLVRMRNAVQQQTQPIYDGFLKMRESPESQLAYRSPGASQEIGRNPTVRSGEFDRDANAAYQCALMWFITGDKAFARICIGILDDWASVLQRITGADAVLCASLGGFKMINAAELIRYTECNWSPDLAQRFGRMMSNAFLPVIINFSPFANGNWDTAAIKLMLSIAIYNEDHALYERALEYYLHGCGDGRLEHYIYANGQCQESGRDQQHTQLGITHQGDCCEIAWNQGLDLYGALENRLLLGFEYTAKYELGQSVDFVPDVDQTGKYRHAVISPRSSLRPGYEQIYNHYVRRKGIPAPWTQNAAEKTRPEGSPFGADATGYGTLLYTRTAATPKDDVSRATPMLHAQSDGSGVNLTFLPMVRETEYTIVRSEFRAGPYRPIVRNLKRTQYRDEMVSAGKLYFYRVAISSMRQLSSPIAQMAGLPLGWKTNQMVGRATFDGSAFTLLAGGAKRIDKGGEYFFLHHQESQAGVFTARLKPSIASSFLNVGVGFRSGVNGNQQELLVTLTPNGENAEHPFWAISLIDRRKQVEAETAIRTINNYALGSPQIDRGRVAAPIWFELECKSGNASAAVSSDGISWTHVGSAAAASERLDWGLFLLSGIDGMTTEVEFDQVGFTPY